MHLCYFLVVVLLLSELADFVISVPQHKEGDIRLIGGRYSFEGTVLIYHQGEWGSICDRYWSRRDASVVCRQLGYIRAYWSVRGSAYGTGSRRRWLASVRCRGRETKLQDCKIPSWGVHSGYRYCNEARRSAGVMCHPRRITTTTTRTTTSTTPPTTTPSTTTTTTTTTPSTTSATTTSPSTTTHSTNTKAEAVTTTKSTLTTVLPKTTTTTLKTTKANQNTATISTRNIPLSLLSAGPPAAPRTLSNNSPSQILSQMYRARGPQSDEQYAKASQNDTIQNSESTVKTTVTPSPMRDVTHSNLGSSSVGSVDIGESTPKLQTSTPMPITTTKIQPTVKRLATTPESAATTSTATTHLNQSSQSKTTVIPTPPTTITTTTKATTTTTTTKATTTTENIMVLADNPNLRRGVWKKDRLLNCYVFLTRGNQVLLSRRGGRPDRMSREEYIKKRWEVMVANRENESDSAEVNTGQDTNSQRSNGDSSNTVNDEAEQISATTNNSSPAIVYIDTDNGGRLAIRMTGGRTSLDGRIEVLPPGKDKWGVVCGDKWSMRETIVACRHLRNTYGLHVVKGSQYGGSNQMKYFSSIECTGKERSLRDCKWKKHDGAVTCSMAGSVAGVVCANALPDLEPNLYMLENSERLQDRPLYYLQCAMEENCLAPSANNITSQYDKMRATRRLMRFSSVIKNIGTADFRPKADRSQWEWHACHMHYHSMDVFAHYDILDSNGNRVAQGLKASFCLEDSACTSGHFPKYECRNYGHQGISVGCSDNYLAEIDCQWVDVTDLKPGSYKFKMEVNPDLIVAELSFDNNVVVCDLHYPGHYANIYNCQLKSLL